MVQREPDDIPGYGRFSMVTDPQGAYFMLAARSLGLDCGPMSGFDNAKLDAAFFAGTTVKSNFLCNIGYGDVTKLYPRSPRLSFEEACTVA